MIKPGTGTYKNTIARLLSHALTFPFQGLERKLMPRNVATIQGNQGYVASISGTTLPFWE